MAKTLRFVKDIAYGLYITFLLSLPPKTKHLNDDGTLKEEYLK